MRAHVYLAQLRSLAVSGTIESKRLPILGFPFLVSAAFSNAAHRRE